MDALEPTASARYEKTVRRSPEDRATSDVSPATVWLHQGAAALLLTVLLGVSAWSYLSGGVLAAVFDSSLTGAEKTAILREFFHQFGWAAPLAYLGLVTAEVIIAPIPGAFLYLPGGAVFGGFWGGTLSLLGNVIGAGAACQIMRTFVGHDWRGNRRRGKSWLIKFAASPKIQARRQILAHHGFWIIVILRVNPLTSSDLISYAAGLTELRASTVMLATLIGMAPLCYAQAYFAHTVFGVFPWLITPLTVACLAYIGIVAVSIWRVGTKP